MDLELADERARGYLLVLEVRSTIQTTGNMNTIHSYLVALFILMASSSSSSEAATTDLALPPAGRGRGRGREFVLGVKKQENIQMRPEA